MRKMMLCSLSFILILSTASCGIPCANGHTWKEADCTAAKTCSVCDISVGKPLDHDVPEYIITTEATCASNGKQQGVCSRCGMTIDNDIPKAPHTDGEWQVTREATETNAGQKTLYCAVCNEEIKSESFTLTAEEIRNNFIQNCKLYSYKEIARNPEKYRYNKAKFQGEVIQVIENGNSCKYRVNVTQNRYSWSDTILVQYTKNNSLESRILEDDIITVYGTLGGNYTYETVMGSEVTIPLITAKYISIN